MIGLGLALHLVAASGAVPEPPPAGGPAQVASPDPGPRLSGPNPPLDLAPAQGVSTARGWSYSAAGVLLVDAALVGAFFLALETPGENSGPAAVLATALVVLGPLAAVQGARVGGERRGSSGKAYLAGLGVHVLTLVAAGALWSNGKDGAALATLVAGEFCVMPLVVVKTLAAGRPAVAQARDGSPALLALPVRDPALLR